MAIAPIVNAINAIGADNAGVGFFLEKSVERGADSVFIKLPEKNLSVLVSLIELRATDKRNLNANTRAIRTHRRRFFQNR